MGRALAGHVHPGTKSMWLGKLSLPPEGCTGWFSARCPREGADLEKVASLP